MLTLEDDNLFLHTIARLLGTEHHKDVFTEGSQ